MKQAGVCAAIFGGCLRTREAEQAQLHSDGQAVRDCAMNAECMPGGC